MLRAIPIFKSFWGLIMTTEQTSRYTSLSGFSAFDPVQLGGLSDAQRDVIARAIVAQGPALIRHGSTQHLLGKAVLGGALAAAAAFALMLQSEGAELKREPVAAVAVARSCAADAQVTPIMSEEAGRSSIQIGSRIRAATAPATRLSIVESEPCLTRLALTEGTLTLQARELGGGAVLVDTPHGQVRAEGTFLRIVTLASSTTIGVVEGEAVMRSLKGAENVGAGRAITIGRTGIERSALSGDERTTLLSTFNESADTVVDVKDADSKPSSTVRGPRTPRPRARNSGDGAIARPAVSSTALLAEADTLWRKGDHEAARRAFRTAAEDKGPMGEAAWVRLARLELSGGSHKRALSALKARRSRVGGGMLGAEALWLEAQALEGAGHRVDARKAAEILIRDYPKSPQAPAARRLVAKAEVP